MWGYVHAIILLWLPILTCVLCFAYGSKPTMRRFATTFSIGAAAAGITLAFAFYWCGFNVPIAQWLIPWACFVLSCTFLRSHALRVVVGALLLFLMFGLTKHYALLVHGPEYVGAMSKDPGEDAPPSEAAWHSWFTGLYPRL